MKDWNTRTLAEAAGVTDSYVRLLLLQGKLHGEKFGHIWRIPYEEGRQWLESRSVGNWAD